jgi:hypothetical protein
MTTYDPPTFNQHHHQPCHQLPQTLPPSYQIQFQISHKMEWAKTFLLQKSAAALTAGIQATGALAGNAIGSAGTAIENTGRGVGNSTSGPLLSSS